MPPRKSPIDLDALMQPHGFEDSVRWSLTGNGLLIEGENVPVGTGGAPVTIRRIWDRFGAIVTDAAVEFGVPIELIMATIATESRGDPDARRAEPGFISEEKTPERVSIGLTQTLISTARQALKDKSITGDDLRDPATAIRAGASYIASQKPRTLFDPPKVACAYNAGSLIHQTGVNNRWKMRQFPIGTGAHADRFVAWFNDCFIHFGGMDKIPGPGFVAALADR